MNLLNAKTMTCQDRLNNALFIDKIKIYPNSDAIIEKIQKVDIKNEFDGNYNSFNNQ